MAATTEKKCLKCQGWGFERDATSSDGWARNEAGNGILCRSCGATGKLKN